MLETEKSTTKSAHGRPRSTYIYIYIHGCGSKNWYQNGTLVSGNMDQNLRNPSCLILSHTHIYIYMHIRRIINLALGGCPLKTTHPVAAWSNRPTRRTPRAEVSLAAPKTKYFGRLAKASEGIRWHNMARVCACMSVNIYIYIIIHKCIYIYINIHIYIIQSYKPYSYTRVFGLVIYEFLHMSAHVFNIRLSQPLPGSLVPPH